MTQRDRIMVGVLAAVAVLVGYWFLVLAPKREEIKKLDAEVTQQEQRRDEAQARVTAGQAAREGYADNYATIARLGKAVPMDDQVPSLVYQLESVARRTEVNFSSFKLNEGAGAGAGAAAAEQPQQPAAKDGAAKPATQEAAATAPPGSVVGPAGFPMMGLDFTFHGSFFGLERFLSQIERMTQPNGDDVRVRGRLLTVNGISLNVSQKGFPLVNGSMSATAFLLSPEDAAATGDPATAGTPAGSAPAPSGGTSAPAPTTATITGAP